MDASTSLYSMLNPMRLSDRAGQTGEIISIIGTSPGIISIIGGITDDRNEAGLRAQ
jgi:hypothetical protein